MLHDIERQELLSSIDPTSRNPEDFRLAATILEQFGFRKLGKGRRKKRPIMPALSEFFGVSLRQVTRIISSRWPQIKGMSQRARFEGRGRDIRAYQLPPSLIKIMGKKKRKQYKRNKKLKKLDKIPPDYLDDLPLT